MNNEIDPGIGGNIEQNIKPDMKGWTGTWIADTTQLVLKLELELSWNIGEEKRTGMEMFFQKKYCSTIPIAVRTVQYRLTHSSKQLPGFTQVYLSTEQAL